MNVVRITSKRTKGGQRIAWMGGILVVALYGFARLRSSPPDVVDRTAPGGVFSAERALDHLARIEGDARPHPVGSEASARVRGEIVAALEALGLAPEVDEHLAVGGNGVVAVVRNVTAKIAGREPGSCVLLSAHYDSVWAGPGSSDDGAGTAAILEIARALRAGAQLKNDVLLLVDEGEEAGLIGARAFVDSDPRARSVGVVLNLEARGTNGRAHMFETSADNAWLMALYARSVPHPAATSIAYELYKRMPNDTDLTVFKASGMAGLNFAYIGGVARYHTPLDDMAHLDPRSLQHLGESVLALARECGELDLAHHASGDAVYVDILGFELVRWPAAWCTWIAILALAGILVGVFRDALGGARGLDRRALIVGFVGALVGLVASAVAAHLIALALVAARGVEAPWSAHPFWTRVCVLGGALAVGLASARGVLRRAETLRGPRAAAHISVAVAALIAAIWLPSASYLVLVPAVGAALVSWTAPKRPALALLVPLALAALCVAPLVVGLEEGFGFRIGAALGAPVGLLVVLLAPAFVEARAGAIAGLAAAATIAFGVALVVPTHNADSPAWLNLAHVHDARSTSAQWFAVPIGSKLPEALAAAGPFSSPEPAAVAWWSRSIGAHCAPAEPSIEPAPRLDAVSETRAGDRRVVRAHLSSPRGALRFAVRVPDGCELLAIERAGTRLVAGFGHTGVVRFTGIDAPGLDLEFSLPGDQPVEVEFIDVSAVLPASSQRLCAARLPGFVPRGEGDVSVIVERARL